MRYHGHAAGPQTATAISAMPRLRTMFPWRERHSSTAPNTSDVPNATTPSADSRPRAPTGTTCATVQPSAVAGVIARRTLSGVENTVVEIHPSPRPEITLTARTTAAATSAPRHQVLRSEQPTRMNGIAAAAGSLIVAASAHNAMPTSILRSTANVTPATTRPIIKRSLCPAATNSNRMSGLSSTHHVARAGSAPSARASRGANTASSTSPATSSTRSRSTPRIKCEPAIATIPLTIHRNSGPYGAVV